jgi:hypothetical protein
MHNIMSLNLDPEILVSLLLDRASTDSDNPEQNLQLKLFADFSYHISEHQPGFRPVLSTHSMSKFFSLIQAPSRVSLIQNVAVWISYLLIYKIVSRRAYFSSLAFLCRLQPPDAASEVIRTSLCVCGAEIDRRNYFEVANFYVFLSLHPSPNRFLAFHVSELFRLRDRDWIMDQSSGVVVATPPDEGEVAARLEWSFERWKKFGELIGGGNVPFPVVARLTFKMMPIHEKEAGLFAAWASALWRAESRDVLVPLEREFSAYVAVVSEPTMWYIVFDFLACLYACRLVGFDTIFRFTYEIPEGCPRPGVTLLLARMAPVAKFEESEVREVARSRRINDPEVIVALVDLCEVPEAGNPINDVFDAALFVRNLIFDRIEEMNGYVEPVEVLRGMERELTDVFKMHTRLVKDVTELTLRDCDLREEQFRKAVEYLSSL